MLLAKCPEPCQHKHDKPTQPYRQCNHNIIIQRVQIKQDLRPTATFHEHYTIHRAIYNLHTQLVPHNLLPPYRALRGS